MNQNKRQFITTELNFLGTRIYLESIKSTFGESDSLIGDMETTGTYDEVGSLARWLWLSEISEPGSVVLDVGAYSGLYSIFAVCRNPMVNAIAFEASSVTYGRLVKNLFLNDIEAKVVAGKFAAWKEKDILEFRHQWGIYTTCSGDSCVGEFDLDFTEEVFAIPLDILLNEPKNRPSVFSSKSSPIQNINNISAIKIDVEGAEPEVLRGAHKIMTTKRPFIIAEILTESVYERVVSICKSCKYTVEKVDNERNYFLIPDEKIGFYNENYGQWFDSIIGDHEIKMNRKITYSIF